MLSSIWLYKCYTARICQWSSHSINILVGLTCCFCALYIPLNVYESLITKISPTLCGSQVTWIVNNAVSCRATNSTAFYATNWCYLITYFILKLRQLSVHYGNWSELNQLLLKPDIHDPVENIIVNKIIFLISKDQGFQGYHPQQPSSYVPPGFPPAQQGPMAYGGGFGHPGQPGQPPIVSQPQTGDGE